jgi:hypothetical protein
MRHTYATPRLSNGDSLAEVSREMEHSSSGITYRTYYLDADSMDYKWLPKEGEPHRHRCTERRAAIRKLSAARKEKRT